jgi:hypothetical protein
MGLRQRAAFSLRATPSRTGRKEEGRRPHRPNGASKAQTASSSGSGTESRVP